MEKSIIENLELIKLKKILSRKDYDILLNTMTDELKKPPKITVIGKSGVGKSSTINSLFNLDETVSHVFAGTLKSSEKLVELPNGQPLKIVDMPGLGEDLTKDEEYKLLYKSILPEADIIMYVIQADLKGLAMDQKILREIVIPSSPNIKDKILICLNQVDKIGPGNWNIKFNFPSPEQQKSIDIRCQDIIKKISCDILIKEDQIEYYSATKRYRLFNLLSKLIKYSGKSGWKYPINPADPVELADKEVQNLIRSQID